jgi:hypothetical protein
VERPSPGGSPERPDESLIEWEQNHQLQLTADEILAKGKLVQVNIKHLCPRKGRISLIQTPFTDIL